MAPASRLESGTAAGRAIIDAMDITVTPLEGARYHVTVDDGHGLAGYEVTVWPSDVERYAPGATPEDLLHASFRFLLEREPKESILPAFELPVIERYFPEYPRRIGALL
ncbi:MAG: hypothetical protein HOP14_10670 [Acidobacteria bacterium]|nr:hypothetical protein [Acidobacteriota bacterium]